MDDNTRYRDLPFKSGRAVDSVRYGGETFRTWTDVSIVGRQKTVSENHPDYFRVKRLKERYAKLGIPYSKNNTVFLGDYGGPFWSTKNEYWNSHPSIFCWATSGTDYFEYRGPLCAGSHSVTPTSVMWPRTSVFDEQLLRSLGATAISRVSPLNPQVSVASMLGELRNDGLPLLPAKQLIRAIIRGDKILSSLGSEYLNIMFGWKPTMKDLRKLSKVVRTSSEMIAQLKRDSGRLIRRSYGFPEVVNSVTTVEQSGAGTYPHPSLHPKMWAVTTGTRTKTTTVTINSWFSGCFSYLLDPGETALEKASYAAEIAQTLYGPGITPEVIWQLTPWSWAIDWFTNIGDVITNLSNWATSGQVMRYGYMMREERIDVTYTVQGPVLKNGPAGPFIQRFTTIDKRRIKASPYGFQLDWADFTPAQLAITAALGLTRSGR
jgi:hypothetical protein